jgi:ferredoxin-NADP reductase
MSGYTESMRITFVSKLTRAPSVYEFTFLPEKTVQYTPGQYAHFRLPMVLHEPSRAFSLTSHPSEPELRFITRIDPSLSQYKTALSRLQPGDTVEIDEPMGDCILPRLQTTPLVFVAQGIALASYLSMLTECARSNLTYESTLLWARRSADDPLKNLIPGKIPKFNSVAIHYPERLTTAQILPLMTAAALVYLSGSQRFVETLGTDLEAAGVPRSRIIYEYYDRYLDL